MRNQRAANGVLPGELRSRQRARRRPRTLQTQSGSLLCSIRTASLMPSVNLGQVEHPKPRLAAILSESKPRSEAARRVGTTAIQAFLGFFAICWKMRSREAVGNQGLHKCPLGICGGGFVGALDGLAVLVAWNKFDRSLPATRRPSRIGQPGRQQASSSSSNRSAAAAKRCLPTRFSQGCSRDSSPSWRTPVPPTEQKGEVYDVDHLLLQKVT